MKRIGLVASPLKVVEEVLDDEEEEEERRKRTQHPMLSQSTLSISYLLHLRPINCSI
jgi:hypothetical protein